MSPCRSEPSTAQSHSSEAATLLRKKVQYRIFKKVARLRKKLRKWPSAYIEPQEFTKLPIQLSTFDLNPEAIDFEPRFCLPLADDALHRCLVTAWNKRGQSLRMYFKELEFCRDCDTSNDDLLRESFEGQELRIDTGELALVLEECCHVVSDGNRDGTAWCFKEYVLPSMLSL